MKTSSPTAAAVFAAIDDPMRSRSDIDEMVFAYLEERAYPLSGNDLDLYRSSRQSGYTAGDISEIAWGKINGLVSFHVMPQRSVNEARLVFHRSDPTSTPQSIKIIKLTWNMPRSLRTEPEFAMLKCLVQAIGILRNPSPSRAIDRPSPAMGFL